MASTLRDQIQGLLNENGCEKESNTPDFILAAYLEACLRAWDEGTAARDAWYGVKMCPGKVVEIESPEMVR